MIKRTLLAACLVFSADMVAAEQYSQTQCNQIEAERERIRDRMRSSYTSQQGERLRRRSTELFKMLGNHCKRPTEGYSRRVYADTYVPPPANELLNKKVHDSTVFGKTYNSDDKRLEWGRFYQLPGRCRAKQMEQTDFVWCSENRAEQRATFEAQWQTKIGLNKGANKSAAIRAQKLQNRTAYATLPPETPSKANSMTLTPVSKADTRLVAIAPNKEEQSYSAWHLLAVACFAFLLVFGLYRWFKN